LVRLVLRLSRLAKIAAAVAAVGGLLAVAGRLTGRDWANVAGSVMLFGGGAVYLVERLRAIRGRSKSD